MSEELERAIAAVNAKPQWHAGPNCSTLVAFDGRVIAEVKCLGGLYYVGDHRYIDLTSAKRAAEKEQP